MSGFLGFVWLMLMLAAAGWIAATALIPVLSWIGLSPRLAPAERRTRLWLMAALPWALPLTLVLAGLFLAAGQLLGLLHDHCLHHGPGHPHICLAHLPQLVLSYPEIFLFASASSYFVLRWLRMTIEQSRQSGHIAALTAFSKRERRCLQIIEDKRLLGFAAGLRKPAIFLSRGLLEQLGIRERRIVLAHEAAHLRHGDLPKTLAFECLLLLHLPWVAASLRMQWSRVIEEHADDVVAERFGPIDVASTLLTVSRSSMQAPVGLSVAGANPAQRIQRLLNGSANKKHGLFSRIYLIALITIGIAIFFGHHQVETLLGWIV